MAEQDWGSTLRHLVEKMAETGVTDLEIRQGDLRIRLKRSQDEHGLLNLSPLPAEGDHVAVPESSSVETAQLHKVAAPLTGVFYSSPNPAAGPYVEPGDWIEESTVVGLIETMKVFNEVIAECKGRVAAVVASQGQLVQVGETVLLVDVDATQDDAGEAVS